jgi:hypothetical protein
VTIAADVSMYVCAGVLALLDAPGWWSFLVPVFLGVPVLTVYGRRAAEALGVKSRNEMPWGELVGLVLPAGLVGVLAAGAGRYGGLIFVTYFVFMQIGERIIWARFLASRRADP